MAERPLALVVQCPEALRTAVEEAGFRVETSDRVDAVAGRGPDAPEVIVLGGPFRHVGLGEMGAPVVAVVGDDAAIADALRHGAHDVVLATAGTAEVAARVKAASRLAHARRALADAARTDQLTGLLNRRHLDEHLDMAASMARRLRKPFSVLVLDIDRMRRVNDEHGHAVGDLVIAEIARRVNHELRGGDVAGRWGGEELLVLLPHTPLDGGWHLAERIRAAVCEEPIVLPGGTVPDVLVTVSVGCAEGAGDDIPGHLRRAHAALDEAKAAGRNKAVAGV